jgi:hypothetical protein
MFGWTEEQMLVLGFGMLGFIAKQVIAWLLEI